MTSRPSGEVERSTYRVVLLDEYQDTGAAQEVLLSSLFGDGHPVTAVGDPCQSIYGWRGASAGTLRRFPSRFGARRTEPRSLSTTYRSGGRILQLANAVSAELRTEGVRVEELQAAPGRDGDGLVRCALLPDVASEATWVAAQVTAALAELPPSPGETWSRAAVLCRKRSMFPRLREAFEALDVPVEVVGLGGLLDVPEVADVLATLRVLDDPTADAALLRLLTGPRWRIGPRDLAVLGRRARALVRRGAPPDDPVEAVVLGVDESQVGSLVDALDDLPPAGDRDPLSSAGRRRLEALQGELRALRRRLDQPLPDLVGDVERTLGLDIEVSARPGTVEPSAARADLDAFADAAASFAGDAAQDGSGEAVLSAFLAFLAAAEDEEHGLDTGAVSGADTVKLMTVHAAKGLEWPVVAVPGLARGSSSAVFPAKPATSTSWTANARLLPFPLRGDADELPALAGLEPAQLTAHLEANAARDAREERRLAYVAVTRAEQLLLCSGYHWGEGKNVLGPSEFLEQAREVCLQGAGDVDTWVEVPPEDNPVTAGHRAAAWPSPRAAGRRQRAGRGRPRPGAARRRGPGRRRPGPRHRVPCAPARLGRGPRPARRGGAPSRRRPGRGGPARPPVGHRAGRAAPRPAGAGPRAGPAGAVAPVARVTTGHRLPRLARAAGLRPAAAAPARRPARQRRRRRPARRAAGGAAGAVPGQRLVGSRPARDRGPVRDGRRGRPRPGADGRRLPDRGRRLGGGRLEDRAPPDGCRRGGGRRPARRLPAGLVAARRRAARPGRRRLPLRPERRDGAPGRGARRRRPGRARGPAQVGRCADGRG